MNPRKPQNTTMSSLEPTTIKNQTNTSTNSYTLFRQEDSGPSIKSIIKKPFKNLYTHQKLTNSIPKPEFETTFQTNPVSKSQIQDKPISKPTHLSTNPISEIEKIKLKAPSFVPETRIENAFTAESVSVSSIQDKPMSKSINQSRKSNLEIEKQKLRASINGGLVKDPIFNPKPSKETSFQSKPSSISSIQDKPMSKSINHSRKTNEEIEKNKLRASVNGGFDKTHDFKFEIFKKLPKNERGKEEKIVSLSKSQDSGLNVVRKSESGDVKRPSFSLVSGGRRRSFSRADLADFLSCNGVKIVSVDMPSYMQIHAVDCARKTCDSLEKYSSKTLALALKKEFDGIYGPAWHCIVGTSFGSFVTHSVGGFMYFSMDHKIYILLFKTTVQRAD